ncbi:unnamed protein product [Alopecurus aequalis]
MVTFTACRKKPEVVVPARPTPREVKSLSDMDSQVGVRVYLNAIDFFRLAAPEGQTREHVASTIKGALAGALVYYYPMAGRVRELPDGKKLVVECTSEGAVFVEAHADVRLEELGKPLVKPHPCIAEFMCDVGDARDVVGKPVLYLQMTQLGCGGLVLALSVSHSLVDVTGMYQIFRCITDLARGQSRPTILPVWERQLLVASSPEEEEEAEAEAVSTTLAQPPASLQADALVTRYFLFGPREIAALRTGLSATATVFELITAAVWRCRAEALQYPPHERVRLFFIVNGRGAWKRAPPLPPGFYGNAGFITTAEAGAAELCGAPLERVVGLVHEAKLRFTDEHVRSYLGKMARGKHSHSPEVALHWSSFIVSDVTRCVDNSLDIGTWAEHVGGGPAVARDVLMSSPCVYKSCKDTNGEVCVLVPMCLPELAMRRFASQIAALTNMSGC